VNGWWVTAWIAVWVGFACWFAVKVGRVCKRRDVGEPDEFGADPPLTPSEYAVVNARFAYVTSDLIDVRVAAQRILEEQR
jgi:hypothetical protein